MTFVTLEVWKIGFTLSSKYVVVFINFASPCKFLLTNCQQLVWLFKILDAKSYKTDIYENAMAMPIIDNNLAIF